MKTFQTSSNVERKETIPSRLQSTYDKESCSTMVDTDVAGSDKTNFMGRTAHAAKLLASLFCTFYFQLHTNGFYIYTILHLGFFFVDNESSLARQNFELNMFPDGNVQR